MKIIAEVRPYPLWWCKLPWVGRFRGQSLYPWIFLQPHIYQDLLADQTDPKNLATYEHELVHRSRQIEIGPIKFGFFYLLSRRFRFEEELMAYRRSIEIWKAYGVDYDLSRVAQSLSGLAYLWCCSYEQALNKLLEIDSNAGMIDS